MEFSELLRKDSYGAFSEFVTIEDAKAEGIIPEAYHSMFKDRCINACGSQKIISRNRKRFMCCDPRCPIKVSHTLALVFKNFECKGIGEATCSDLVFHALDRVEFRSHLPFLVHGTKILPTGMGSAALDNIDYALEKINSLEMSFGAMIKKIGIPSIAGGAEALFAGIENSDMLNEKIREIGSIELYCANRGVYDPKKMFYLQEFLSDIAYMEKKVIKGLVPLGKVNIEIVPTGNLTYNGHSITKDNFVILCNTAGKLKNGEFLFEVKRNTAIESTRFVIASKVTDSRKFNSARDRELAEGRMNPQTGEFEKKKIIFSPEEFIAMLKKLAEQYKKQYGLEDE